MPLVSFTHATDWLIKWLIKDFKANERQHFIEQQDGAPLHWKLYKYELISTKTCQKGGLGVPVIMTMCL